MNAVPLKIARLLLEGRRVDNLHSDHLFEVVLLASVQFRIQRQEVVDGAGAGRNRVSPPDALPRRERAEGNGGISR